MSSDVDDDFPYLQYFSIQFAKKYMITIISDAVRFKYVLLDPILILIIENRTIRVSSLSSVYYFHSLNTHACKHPGLPFTNNTDIMCRKPFGSGFLP